MTGADNIVAFAQRPKQEPAVRWEVRHSRDRFIVSLVDAAGDATEEVFVFAIASPYDGELLDRFCADYACQFGNLPEAS